MKSLKPRERNATGEAQQQPEQPQGEQQQPQETTPVQPQQAENNNTDQRTLSPQPGPSTAAD